MTDQLLLDAPAAGFDLPATLTPSKISKFVSCPLAFRFSYLERLPEPASPQQVRGTLLHRTLQLLFSEGPAGSRTRARALQALEAAWGELADGPEVEDLHLDERGEATFVKESAELVERYFALEDPTTVHPVGLELDLRARLGDVELRGIIDRLDRLPDGDLVVVDYKTGRAPAPSSPGLASAGCTSTPSSASRSSGGGRARCGSST